MTSSFSLQTENVAVSPGWKTKEVAGYMRREKMERVKMVKMVKRTCWERSKVTLRLLTASLLDIKPCWIYVPLDPHLGLYHSAFSYFRPQKCLLLQGGKQKRSQDT
jgi:hypothetical protein